MKSKVDKRNKGEKKKYTNKYLKKIISKKAYRKAYRLAYEKGKKEGKKRGTLFLKMIIPSHQSIENEVCHYANFHYENVEVLVYLLPNP